MFCFLLRVTLELSLRHSLADKKMEYDCYVKAQKDKERDSKNLKKLELQLKAAQDSLSNIRLQYEKIMIQANYKKKSQNTWKN
jgi:hypothetical protein